MDYIPFHHIDDVVCGVNEKEHEPILLKRYDF